ncbi:sarcoplasmic calcium-binding protein-like [Haliotis cracherodii]|uniref:sarcoplasmic calcium-binding protein-like n=1 Tax=Haliotis rufescens TaxID=6454 RepID=UPI001EAFEE10|nr:sarcoplasmic calcium-binding protein-like [Haliotis rufescens]
MADNALLESKIRAWFKMTDAKKDGCMCREDFQLIADRFVAEYKLGPEKATEIRNWLVDGWDKILHDETCDIKALEADLPLVVAVNAKLRSGEKISEDDFTEAFLQLRNKDLSLAKKSLENMIDVFFGIFDANADGFIIMPEMVVAMKCFGLENSELVKQTFECMDKDKDGKLSKDDYIGSWTDFFFGEESENPLLTCFAAFMAPGAAS